jgi:hypothetical protein
MSTRLLPQGYHMCRPVWWGPIPLERAIRAGLACMRVGCSTPPTWMVHYCHSGGMVPYCDRHALDAIEGRRGRDAHG